MINQINIHRRDNKQTGFKSKESYLYKELDRSVKPIRAFVKTQEDLKVTRFIQCEVTNLTPKAILARSVADISEQAFLELTEASLFFFAPAILGNLFNKALSKLHPKELQKSIQQHVVKNTDELLRNSSEVSKRAVATKAGIILACAVIPAGEYALSFAKNLFTLKVFKKSDFNNVANLNKEQKEDVEHQKKVENSVYKHFKDFGIITLGGLAAGVALAKHGHKSETLQKFSSLILQPGVHIAKGLEKIGLGGEKTKKFFKTYVTPDFDTGGGRLGLSKGQLFASMVTGFFGYSAAGKDRGKLDQLEVWTRVPIVIFYTVFGSQIFEHVFKNALHKKGKYPELIKKEKDEFKPIPSLKDIEGIAEKEALKNKAVAKTEYAKLVKQKAFILGVPYAFTIVFFGFLLAGITRFWTQYRFNQAQKAEQEQACR